MTAPFNFMVLFRMTKNNILSFYVNFGFCFIFSTYEKVRLILMPWKKPEGLLNKPVFKMMIESLMLYVMTFSGANLNNICEKYSPYLQTFSVRELLDVSSYIGD